MNIWTNGCFDILHIGHLELFKYAKKLGDKLFVGIDSDDRIKKYKGENRPFNNQVIRLSFLQSIKYIDAAVIFNTDDDLRSIIKILRVDLIVVGDDYKDRYVIGSEYAPVIFFPKLHNYSTTKIHNELSNRD